MQMELCAENYYSTTANEEYMSVSLYKDFIGTYGKAACEEQALAKLRGEWVEEKSTALLVGGYVDAYFEGSLDEYKLQNPELFVTKKVFAFNDVVMSTYHPEWYTKNGRLKSEMSMKKIEELEPTYVKMENIGMRAEYIHADNIIRRIERDPYMMKTLSGEKQVIMTGEIGGAKWKIKMDSYLPNVAIVDLKIVESIHKHKYVPDLGHLNFVEYWGYDLQGAVYQEIVRQNTGKQLPFYITVATKEKEPRIEVIYIPQSKLDDALKGIEVTLPHVLDVKNGRVKPIRCGLCDYCAHTHVITKPISLFDLQQSI